MKTRTWIMLLAAAVALCVGLSLWLLWPREDASQVEIWSDGELKHTLSLKEDQTLTIESGQGRNVVTIRDGKIAVTEADCPDGYCMARGYCSGGAQIVCLPNRLVIRFLGQQSQDSVAG